MDEVSATVELGVTAEGTSTHTYELVPQRHARLERRLVGEHGVFSSLDDLAQLDEREGLDNIVNLLGGYLYDVLHVFIPDLMPRHEFNGFATAEAMDASDYNENADTSPTVPQIVAAFRVAIDVNGLRWVGKLKDFFDPRLVRAQLNAVMAKWAAEQRKRLAETNGSPDSESLQPPSGESEPTTSGTSEPTPEPPTEVVSTPSD